MIEKDGTEKGVVHADMWVLDPRTMDWNKVMLWILKVTNPGNSSNIDLVYTTSSYILKGSILFLAYVLRWIFS